MKRTSWIPAIISLVLIAGCAPDSTKDTEVINDIEKDEEVAKTIIPSLQISKDYYRTLLPYAPSKSRGLVVSNVYSKYDIKEVESGLLRLSQRTFSADDYLFQEGQMLDTDTLRAWLTRKGEVGKDKDNKEKKAEVDLGLNPVLPGGEITAELAKTNPKYLAHIVEQNYMVKTKDNTIKLGGVSIGLAMNSVYYYKVGDYGPYEQPIPQATIEEQGKKMAAEIIKRMRAMEGLENVPITVGLFKQEDRNSIVPGTYFAYSVADEGKALGDWNKLNEEYVIFPQPPSEVKYRKASDSFKNFKQDVEEYFSNYTSIIGTGFYQEDQIKKLTIDIPIQFYGSAELIGFTQYMTGLVMEHFPASLEVEVSVTSINGPEAVVIKKADAKEPYVHIYD
ncbi:CamS family sex pheromone protein [Paenisporosarcina sp. OV554]|uniref:CamS family sex pheromone protein n=1 Tax=Paenisporosarcina sp. OV554 TaxID=2135694 RepID=UPI000D3C60C4|nr:CamS family sex pheromone protein [Paenisporosarcina sp. OV554]PUB10489.1 protein involved in sex pheromone biosynthesis [Paenisporosarcina sp. OV554]